MPGRQLTPFDVARSRAVYAAEREHQRLGTDLTQRVDIFNIIEQAGVWLMFQPLKDLYGAYDRRQDAAGIVINAKHPLSLQRFTAAHEFGHHVLGHPFSLDWETQIEPGHRRLALQEIEAQTFASHFLMPLKLINAILRNMDLPLRPSDLSPRQAYLLALEFGVSYAAAVTHLVTIGKISLSSGRQLRRLQPKEIKKEIGRGIGPKDAWADVWPIEEQDAGKRFYPRVNDEIRISLPEMSSTGYIWIVSEPTVVTHQDELNRSLALVSERFESRAQAGLELRIAAGGTHHFVFRVLRPGHQTLRLEKRRPWESDVPPTAVFEVDLETSAKRTGESDQGLSEPQKELLASAA